MFLRACKALTSSSLTAASRVGELEGATAGVVVGSHAGTTLVTAGGCAGAGVACAAALVDTVGARAGVAGASALVDTVGVGAAVDATLTSCKGAGGAAGITSMGAAVPDASQVFVGAPATAAPGSGVV